MYCQECGKICKEHQKFCTRCGCKLEKPNEQPEKENIQEKQVNTAQKFFKARKNYIIIPCCILCVLIGLTILFVKNNSTADNTNKTINQTSKNQLKTDTNKKMNTTPKNVSKTSKKSSTAAKKQDNSKQTKNSNNSTSKTINKSIPSAKTPVPQTKTKPNPAPKVDIQTTEDWFND